MDMLKKFKKFSATLAVTEASQRRLFFEQQLSQAKDNLAKSRGRSEDHRAERPVLIQLDAQARAAIQLVADCEHRLLQRKPRSAPCAPLRLVRNPELQMAEQELAGLRSQEEKMGAAFGGHKQMRLFLKEICRNRVLNMSGDCAM